MKIYSSKGNKLIVYLPFEVTKQLDLKGDDEVDFFRLNNKAFIFAKKGDISEMLLSNTRKGTGAGTWAMSPGASRNSIANLTLPEIKVLRKLDTLRYADRTAAKVGGILSEQEKRILEGLMGKRVVWIFKGAYSIDRGVYEKFLMGTRARQEQQKPKMPEAGSEEAPVAEAPLLPVKVENENIERLEKEGFVVLQTQPEAMSLSAVLEDSIRSGKVLGIRAFNKKFYIVLRSFFDKNSGKVIKELKQGPSKVEDVAKSAGLDEDGVRAMLYLLSEQGDVSERRKDVFTLI